MNKNFHDEFMDNNDLLDIDNRLISQAGGSDLVDQMQQESEKTAARRFDWMGELKRHKFTYALLGFSAIFTVMLAVYLGLAPTLITDPETGYKVIHFNTDFGHLITMLVYVLVFPGITEVAFAVARTKFKERESNNFPQAASMFVAMFAAVISIIGTGVAGGYVVASTIGFLKKFAEIPDSVQNWIIWIIPVLLALYAVLYTIYELSSRMDRSERFVKENERRELLNHEMRRKAIELAGKRKTQAASILLYERMVMSGLLSQSEADAALASGKSLAQLERDLNRDLTGEGKVGDTSGLSQSRPAPQAELPSYVAARLDQDYGLGWKNSTDISPTLDAYAWTCKCGGTNPPYTRTCQWCRQLRTNGSPVTAFSDLPPASKRQEEPHYGTCYQCEKPLEGKGPFCSAACEQAYDERFVRQPVNNNHKKPNFH